MFLIKIAKREKPRSQYACIVKHLKGADSGTVQIVKAFSLAPVLSFESTKDLNEFLKNGNDQFMVVAINRPKVYFTTSIIRVCSEGWYSCQATVWPEGDDTQKEVVRGPKKATSEDAAKAFWFFWNHGQHPYKTEEGNAARLVRLKNGYEEVII